MNEKDSKKGIIASRIREARKMSGLSQAQVAKMLNLHRPSVSEMEAGHRSVSADELSRLAQLFEVSVPWLSGERAEKIDPQDDKVQLAARELNKLQPDALDRLLKVLASLRDEDDE